MYLIVFSFLLASYWLYGVGYMTVWLRSNGGLNFNDPLDLFLCSVASLFWPVAYVVDTYMSYKED